MGQEIPTLIREKEKFTTIGFYENLTVYINSNILYSLPLENHEILNLKRTHATEDT